MLLRRTVQPCRRGWIVRPGIVRSGVIDHVVHQHLHSLPMGGGNELLQVFQRPEVIFHPVEVSDVVAVIIRGVAVVLPPRRQPQRGNSEIVEIVEVLGNALQVPTVIGMRILAVVVTMRVRRIVVRWIAVGKPVGHDQVNHVARVYALRAAGKRCAFFQIEIE